MPDLRPFFVPLGYLADFASIVAAAAAGFAAFQFWMARRAYRRRLRTLATQRSRRPAALAVGFGIGGIEGQVRQYLADQDLADVEVLTVSRDHRLSADEYPGILRELVEYKQRLTESAATEVLVFYKGPVTLAMAIGAMLDNWVPARLYAFEDGAYELELLLDKRGIIDPASGASVAT